MIKTPANANTGDKFTVVLGTPIKEGSTKYMFYTQEHTIMVKEVFEGFNEFMFNNKFQASRNPKSAPAVGDPIFNPAESKDLVLSENEKVLKELKKALKNIQEEITIVEGVMKAHDKSTVEYDKQGLPIDLKIYVDLKDKESD